MSCCGGGSSRRAVVLPQTGNAVAAATPNNVRPTLAVFRYEGTQPIVVIGGVTKTKYRFAAMGTEVAVDIRDRTSVRQVPRLREIWVV